MKQYTEFLNVLFSVYGHILSLRNFDNPYAITCFLRHDVDHDIDTALRMAEIEAAHCIHSTYFVRHTAPYYQRPDSIDKYKAIQDMGHEIGLHNDIMTFAIKERWDPRDLLQLELNVLRNQGIDVVGTSSHGDPLCRELDYRNYQVFKQCKPNYEYHYTGDVPLYQIDMHEVGLTYEAYFLLAPSIYYITDSGGKWTALNQRCPDEWHPDYLKAKPIEDINVFLRSLGDTHVRITQILTHPQWWRK